MTILVDLVNFNADASCMDSARWLNALAGGAESEFCRWLRLYADQRKRVMLGLTGATVADLSSRNPEALELIRSRPDIFEGVLRPFSHDVAPLRSRAGFARNVGLGQQAIRNQFPRVCNFFLPAEFMLSNEQVALLAQRGITGVFVNASRLSNDVRARVPTQPYWLRVFGGLRLGCVPVAGELTHAYLDGLHHFDPAGWSEKVCAGPTAVKVVWRDGESSFFLPDGLARERHWLEGERGFNRAFLSDLRLDYREERDIEPDQLHSYPAHSVLAWMREFRMLGYLGRLQKLEERVDNFDPAETALWLQAINSDVLSAVEKPSPRFQLTPEPGSEPVPHILRRAERGYEGEESLSILEHLRHGQAGLFKRFLATTNPHAAKLSGRYAYLRQLDLTATPIGAPEPFLQRQSDHA